MPTIMDKTVCLDVTFRRIGIRRKADLSQVETDADKSLLGLSKAIVDSAAYKDAGRVARELRAWIESRAVPSPLKRGTYLIPLPVLEAVYAKVATAEAEYQAAADQFAAEWPTLVHEARQRLGTQFDEDNYPDVREVRESFTVERRLFDFAAPGQNKLSEYVWEQEKERAEADWRAAADEVKAALRESFAQLCGRLAERLEAGPDGKRRVLRDSCVENLLAFLELFEARNVCDDAALAELAGRAREVLAGKTPDDLRRSEPIRTGVQAAMAAVTTAAVGLVEELPLRRRITLEEDTA